MSDAELTRNLHNTTDAQLWAQEWLVIAREKGDLLDEGWMIGWFANAIETGRSHPDWDWTTVAFFRDSHRWYRPSSTSEKECLLCGDGSDSRVRVCPGLNQITQGT